MCQSPTEFYHKFDDSTGSEACFEKEVGVRNSVKLSVSAYHFVLEFGGRSNLVKS